MRKNRSQDAWIWVAVAAITLASLARAQSGIENARAYAAPVIKFLSGNPLAESGGAAANYRAGAPAPGGAFGPVFDLFPVFFVGLAFCFGLMPAAWRRPLGRALCAPSLPGLLQRPPPRPFA